jgi:hypothetical protein
MASHAGWTEAGDANAPTYSGTHRTMVFDPAVDGAKALSSVASFAITGSGTIKGCFVVTGPGAQAAIDSGAGPCCRPARLLAATTVDDILIAQTFNKSTAANAISPPDASWTEVLPQEVNDCTTPANDHRCSRCFEKGRPPPEHSPSPSPRRSMMTNFSALSFRSGEEQR